jgi:hypothetical protein
MGHSGTAPATVSEPIRIFMPLRILRGKAIRPGIPNRKSVYRPDARPEVHGGCTLEG